MRTMDAFIKGMLNWYFDVLEQFDLLGVVVLMAMESSIFPVPSEFVMPPAAYHAREGGPVKIALVILAGTFGSYLGSAITYWVARGVGRPLIIRYGKYCFIPEKKFKLAERWVGRYGPGGVFFARLLPVVRHLISIPAGIIGMRFRNFSIMTILGSFIWCTVLTILGLVMANDMQVFLSHHGEEEPETMKQAMHNLTLVTVGTVGAMIILYIAFVKRQEHKQPDEDGDELAEHAGEVTEKKI
jgi:membrane protein DedA with SNARE-associated domain